MTVQYVPTLDELKVLTDYWLGQRMLLEDFQRAAEELKKDTAELLKQGGGRVTAEDLAREAAEVQERLTLLRQALGPGEFTKLYDEFCERIRIGGG